MNKTTYTLEKNGSMTITLPPTAVARLVRLAVAINATPWTQGGETAESVLAGLVGNTLDALATGDAGGMGDIIADHVAGMIDTGADDRKEDARRRVELAATADALMKRPIDPELTDAA